MITVKTIKTGDAWELDVLGIPYGGHDNGRDSDKQYFDETTQLHGDKYGLPTATVYHSLNDAGNGLTESVEYVGKAGFPQVRLDNSGAERRHSRQSNRERRKGNKHGRRWRQDVRRETC